MRGVPSCVEQKQTAGSYCWRSAVASITSSAMDGTTALQDALEERLRIIDCTPQVGRCVESCLKGTATSHPHPNPHPSPNFISKPDPEHGPPLDPDLDPDPDPDPSSCLWP